MLRLVAHASAIFGFLLACLPVSLGLAGAQEPPPPDNTLCAEPDPARAIHLALSDDKLIVAVVQPTAARDIANGTPVQITKRIEGEFALDHAIADRQPALACLSEGVWDDGKPVLGVFMVEGNELFTLAAWPFTADGAQTSAGALSINELLARGRAYVEPTPTALPAGVPPPPTIVPPSAGQGAVDDTPTGSGGTDLAAWLAVAGVAAVAGGGVLYGTRRRP